jgi:hypothetical protein
MPHRVESVCGSAEQRVLLPSHCTGLSAGHVQKPVDVSQTLSPWQGEGHVVGTQVPFWQVPPLQGSVFCVASGLHLCRLHRLHAGQGFCLEHRAASASGAAMPSSAVAVRGTTTRREVRAPKNRVIASKRSASIVGMLTVHGGRSIPLTISPRYQCLYPPNEGNHRTGRRVRCPAARARASSTRGSYASRRPAADPGRAQDWLACRSAHASHGGPPSTAACRREHGDNPPATEATVRGMTRQALKTVSAGAAAWDAGVGAGVSGTVRRPTANNAEAAWLGAVGVAGARRGNIAARVIVAAAESTPDGRAARTPPGGILRAGVVERVTGADTGVDALPGWTATLEVRAGTADRAAPPHAALLLAFAQGRCLVGECGEQTHPRDHRPEDGHGLAARETRGERSGESIKAVSIHDRPLPKFEGNQMTRQAETAQPGSPVTPPTTMATSWIAGIIVSEMAAEYQ